MYFQNSTKYYMIFDVDMNHSHKTITIQSPLQVSYVINDNIPTNVCILPISLSVLSSYLFLYLSTKNFYIGLITFKC